MPPQRKHARILLVQIVWVCLAASVAAGCSGLPGFLLRLTPPPLVSQAPAGTDGLSDAEYQSLLDGWREGDTLRQAYAARADRAPQGAAAAADLGYRSPQLSPTEPEAAAARSTIAVPDVTHLPYAHAVEQLAALGLRAARQEDVSTSVPAETVLRQQPAAGEEVLPDGVVTLVVSLGNRVRMPALVGLHERDGLRLLEAAGLRVPSWGINYQGHGTDIPDSTLELVCVGCILSTRPAAGSPVPIGSEVYFAVRSD